MWETIWTLLDRSTIIISLVGAVFAAAAWLKTRHLLRMNREAEAKRRAPITIRLIRSSSPIGLEESSESQTLELPYKPTRDQLSRQELTGLLSFYYGEPRFDPAIVRRVLENGDLQRVLAGDELTSAADEVLRLVVDQRFYDQVKKNLGQSGDKVESTLASEGDQKLTVSESH